MAEDVEKLIEQVEIWEAETESLLELLRCHEGVDASVEESLQVGVQKY